MKVENLKAVEALREKIRAKEDEARQLKVVVNSFFTDEGEAPPYPNVKDETSASLGSLRTDHFYGSTLAEAAQAYLEMRKSSGLGSAAVNDIYAALKGGGYSFDTKNEEYAKNGVRISLRKNPTIFHQLPGGDYGLCSWYGVKGPKEDKPSKKNRKKRPAVKAAGKTPEQPKSGAQEANGQPPPRKTTIKVPERSHEPAVKQ